MTYIYRQKKGPRISSLELFSTNKALPETVSFNLKAECPNEAKDFKTSIFMRLDGLVSLHIVIEDVGRDLRVHGRGLGAGGSLEIGFPSLLEVDLPCGEMKSTLNLSVDTPPGESTSKPSRFLHFSKRIGPFKGAFRDIKGI